MAARYKFLAVGVLLLLAYLAPIAWDYFDYSSVAHVSMQFQLKLFGAAIYEFHTATGRWPASLHDLAQTSLVRKSSAWREIARPMVILWPKDLNPEPKDNPGMLLAYYSGGLFNQLGRVWVCWGDLRTEHLPKGKLAAQLSRQAGPH